MNAIPLIDASAQRLRNTPSLRAVVASSDLMTHILDFLHPRQRARVVPHMPPDVRRNYYDLPAMHTLLYGQIQSGKTRRILDYIQQFCPRLPKVLVIQNSIVMLRQYVQSLRQRNISFQIVTSDVDAFVYRQEQVILTIHNKFRMNALDAVIRRYRVPFCLVLDESDQCLRAVQRQLLYRVAKHVLHVTATPFVYEAGRAQQSKGPAKVELDAVIHCPLPDNYVGLAQTDVRECVVPEPTLAEAALQQACAVLDTDFARTPNGLMLVTCPRTIRGMRDLAHDVARKYPHLPVVVLSERFWEYRNGACCVLRQRTVHAVIDQYPGPLVLVANRLANRGVNYTDSAYRRNITHQVTILDRSTTAFLQRCRIFGIRPPAEGDDVPAKPVLYCLVKKQGATRRVFKAVKRLGELRSTPYDTPAAPPAQTQTPAEVKGENANANANAPPKAAECTVAWLKARCAELNLPTRSKTRKPQLLEMLNAYYAAHGRPETHVNVPGVSGQ